jgi:hypothetical protein
MRCWLILFGLATAMLVVGCGSSSPPLNEFRASTETEETSAPPPSTEESQSGPGGPLADVGTITESDGEGTTFSDRYRVGPLMYSEEVTPPEEVLEACNLNYPTELATSVFAHGEVTLTYQEGTLPTEVSLGSVTGPVVQEVYNGEVESGNLNNLTAFRISGEWSCTSTSLGIEFQQGESQTLPFWVIVPRVLSNAQPRIPASVFNTWYFEAIGPYLGSRTVKTSGPGAALCEGAYGVEEHLLFLYNRSGSC